MAFRTCKIQVPTVPKITGLSSVRQLVMVILPQGLCTHSSLCQEHFLSAFYDRLLNRVSAQAPSSEKPSLATPSGRPPLHFLLTPLYFDIHLSLSKITSFVGLPRPSIM